MTEPTNFADRLIDAVAARRCPACVGLDPTLDRLPPSCGTGLPAIETFCHGVLDAVADVVPVVKLQSAYFERFGGDGVSLYFRLIARARTLGLLTIGDVKRGDIGPTSAAYADAHLLAPDAPDAITVSPMLGPDTLAPFLDAAASAGRGLFVLVRTSNPGSADFQDVELKDGRTWSQLVADALAPLAADPRHVGRHGWSSVGAVVGATQAHTIADLRRRLPRSTFLLPGYGTQGATADMTRAAFDADGRGAVVSASRSVLYPPGDPADWQANVRSAAERMRDDLASVLR